MIIQSISASKFTFGLHLNRMLEEDIAVSRKQILKHTDPETREAVETFFNSKLDYINNTLPMGTLALLHKNQKNENKEYLLSNGNAKAHFLIEGTDPCYSKLTKHIKNLRRRKEFRQTVK